MDSNPRMANFEALPEFLTAKELEKFLRIEVKTIQAVGISVWKTKEDAERFHRDVLPRRVNTVQQLLDTPPTVRGFNVESSQIFRIAEGKAA